MVLGKDCGSALRGFLEKAAENMDQSAKDEAFLRSYFINGLGEGAELAGKSSGATLQGSSRTDSTDVQYPPVDSGNMGSIEQDVAPLEPLVDVDAEKEGFLPATAAVSSSGLPDGHPADSSGANHAGNHVDVCMSPPGPEDDAGNNGSGASQLLRAEGIDKNIGDVQDVAPDIPVTDSSGLPAPPSSDAIATPAIIASAVTPALPRNLQFDEESELSALTDDSDHESATPKEVDGGSLQVKSPQELLGGMQIESGRVRKPAAIFTAGTVLNPRPPPKKCARVAGAEL